MPIMTQLFILLLICLAGEGLSAILPFAFPGTVLSMVLLLLLLLARVLKPRQLRETSEFFLNNMTLFFLPSCVAMVQYLDVLLDNLWAIVLISAGTMPLVFFVTGQVVQLTMKWLAERGGEAQ